MKNAKKFINVSNHQLSEEQLAMIGNLPVVSQGFPNVDPNWSKDQVDECAHELVRDILGDQDPKDLMVLIQGEMTLVYKAVSLLQAAGATCVAATTERVAVEKDGVKTSVFKHVQFREY